MPYKVLEHTADFRMAVSGKDLAELFQSAFLGMMDYLKEKRVKKITVSHLIKIESVDETGLLIDFLNEILTLVQINKEIYKKIKFHKLTNTELEAEIFGYSTDSFDHDIKAVTYHEADIKKEGNFLKTNIVFDI